MLHDVLQIVRMTHPGLVREHNEDVVASDADIGLLLLADGMGGYQAGEVASDIATSTVMSSMQAAMQHAPAGGQKRRLREYLETAVARANQAVYNVGMAVPECHGMGTTLVAGLFDNNQLMVAHIGDSRLYRWRAGELALLTEDHSVLQEQINAGLMNQDEARHSHLRNLLTRALGTDAEVELDINVFDVCPEDLYLLCSDGLTDMLTDLEIAEILDDDMGLDTVAEALIKAANHQGGRDNISVLLCRVLRAFPAVRHRRTPWQVWRERFE